MFVYNRLVSPLKGSSVLIYQQTNLVGFSERLLLQLLRMKYKLKLCNESQLHVSLFCLGSSKKRLQKRSNSNQQDHTDRSFHSQVSSLELALIFKSILFNRAYREEKKANETVVNCSIDKLNECIFNLFRQLMTHQY